MDRIPMSRATAIIAAAMAHDECDFIEVSSRIASSQSRLRTLLVAGVLPDAVINGRRASMPAKTLLLATLLTAASDADVSTSRLAEIAPQIVADPLWPAATTGAVGL